MNFVDIAILIVLVTFLVKGIWRGLLREVCSFVGLLAGAFLAFRFSGSIAGWMTESLQLPAKLCAAAAFLILFLAIIVFFAVLGYVLSRFVRLLFLGGLNRVAGGLFGLAEGALLLSLVMFAVSSGGFSPGTSMLRDSHLAPPFIHLGKATCEGSRHLLAG